MANFSSFFPAPGSDIDITNEQTGLTITQAENVVTATGSVNTFQDDGFAENLHVTIPQNTGASLSGVVATRAMDFSVITITLDVPGVDAATNAVGSVIPISPSTSDFIGDINMPGNVNISTGVDSNTVIGNEGSNATITLESPNITLSNVPSTTVDNDMILGLVTGSEAIATTDRNSFADTPGNVATWAEGGNTGLIPTEKFPPERFESTVVFTTTQTYVDGTDPDYDEALADFILAWNDDTPTGTWVIPDDASIIQATLVLLVTGGFTESIVYVGDTAVFGTNDIASTDFHDVTHAGQVVESLTGTTGITIGPNSVGDLTAQLDSTIFSAATASDVTIVPNVTAPTFIGNLTGNVTGNVTGALTGNADTATTATNYTVTKPDVDTALGTDAADNTFFYRGDGTWADVPDGVSVSSSYTVPLSNFGGTDYIDSPITLEEGTQAPYVNNKNVSTIPEIGTTRSFGLTSGVFHPDTFEVGDYIRFSGNGVVFDGVILTFTPAAVGGTPGEQLTMEIIRATGTIDPNALGYFAPLIISTNNLRVTGSINSSIRSSTTPDMPGSTTEGDRLEGTFNFGFSGPPAVGASFGPFSGNIATSTFGVLPDGFAVEDTIRFSGNGITFEGPITALGTPGPPLFAASITMDITASSGTVDSGATAYYLAPLTIVPEVPGTDFIEIDSDLTVTGDTTLNISGTDYQFRVVPSTESTPGLAGFITFQLEETT